MYPDGVAEADVDKYMNGLRRAQIDLDLAPEKYKHFYLNEIPDRYKTKVDVRRFSSGERIVFLPYGRDTYRTTQTWLRERALFGEQQPVIDFADAVAR
jgi:hypothetical protein